MSHRRSERPVTVTIPTATLPLTIVAMQSGIRS